MSNFKDEFAAHPEADELYVVNGMPFLGKIEAENFARGTKHPIEVVKRGGKEAAAADDLANLAKATKSVVIQLLTERGIDFDPKAPKAELLEIMEASIEEQ